jgi:hypothetical protein
MFLIYLHIIICLEFTTSSLVCAQDRVNGVLPKKTIPFARKGKMTTLPHPPPPGGREGGFGSLRTFVWL